MTLARLIGKVDRKRASLLVILWFAGTVACLVGQTNALESIRKTDGTYGNNGNNRRSSDRLLGGDAPAGILPDLASVPKDLETPRVVADKPAAGRRVRQVTPGYEATGVYHTLYLPSNWQPSRAYPVLVEYAGNGDYTNKYGDTCSGTVEGCSLGYGISGGSNYLWVCLPFVQTSGGKKQNATHWWGDVSETVAYCTNTLRFLSQSFGADSKAVVLTGFSRGAIACNYIGLHDDAISSVWRAFIPCSHYDGVRTNWGYAEADRASALRRLARLQGRPQFICQEGSTKATEVYLQSTGVEAPFTFMDIPFRNHNDQWVLRDVPARTVLRRWLQGQGLP